MKAQAPLPPCLRPPAAGGLTMAELLVTIAGIGIAATVLLRFNDLQWRRAQINAVALSLNAWLEEVSISPERDSQPCEVTINSGTLAPGAVLASVTPTSCATDATLRVQGLHARTPVQVASTVSSFSFTPRGAVSTETGDGAASTATNLEVRMSVQGQPPLRCLRIFGTVGLIRQGRNNSAGSTDQTCPELSRL
jgi:hypothetical protein